MDGLQEDSRKDRLPGSQHLLTVVLEDWFQVAPLKSVVDSGSWYRFESRVEANTRRALDLLDQFDQKATFFVLGWIAEEMPELVREVASRGHEIASKGYRHRAIRELSRGEFREDLLRSREVLERAAAASVRGYRIAHGWLRPEHLWALDVLAEEGFAYDSSICPIFRRFAREPWRRLPHQHRSGEAVLWELPLPAWSLGGWCLPIAGGNYFRQFPHWLMRRAVAAWEQKQEAPFLMYFHIWELDPDQPRVAPVPPLERIRQYRNLEKMREVVSFYLERYRFTGIGAHLGLSGELARDARSEPTASTPRELPHVPRSRDRKPVTVVVPCLNEELTLRYMANTLKSVEAALEPDYELSFVFVDDGSSDDTWQSLRELFGSHPNCRLLRHEENRGVAAAILTGIQHAKTEIVASIDCDCTYDPHQLEQLIPMLGEGVDMVTASPYHKLGRVQNVSRSRLLLSKGLSQLYREVLQQQLATYTSCFRVYRRSSVVDIEVREGGFLGVAEMLALLGLRGGKIVECPAVLEARLLGRSKMKVVRTGIGHLRLLARLSGARWNGTATPIPGSADAQTGRSP